MKSSKKSIHLNIEFLFDHANHLYLKVDYLFNSQPISLSLSTFMQFLYKNESRLTPNHLDFSYKLIKLIKKIQFESQLIYAIPTDFDMALLFKYAIHHHIHMSWQSNDGLKPVILNDTLPITIEVTEYKNKLFCHFINHKQWLNDPLQWLIFREQKKTYCFSNGTVKLVKKDFLNFMNRFLDKHVIQFSRNKAIFFIKELYQLHKNTISWSVKADFMEFIPQDVSPVPLLNITYAEPILTPTIMFKYAKEVIPPDYHEPVVTNKSNGKQMNRLMDMEMIYQQDLMDLFNENQLPFMLQNPGDIAKFLDLIVPILKDRGWVVDSNVPNFKVSKKPIDITFNVSSSDRDFFYFEPNCTIDGNPHSLQEMASLMIQNQGYIKTKTGFVQLSSQSQRELSTLSELNAFRTGQTFSKSEVLPLITAASVTGTSEDVKTIIARITDMEKLNRFHIGSAFSGTLRDYQVYGVNWMFMLCQMGLGGILADDMGLGKTVQTLALTTQMTGTDPVLIVGPTNVIYNWENEIKQFLPENSCLIYSGSNRHDELSRFKSVDFVITSFGVLKNDLPKLSPFNYKAIFVDEAQYIKNPRTQISKAIKRLKSEFRLVMTGTPIENQLQDIWNLFDFIMPGYLGTQRKFDLDISESRHQIIKTKIKPFVLRREKREVLDSLPEKTEIIIKCPLSTEQLTLYKTVLSATKKGILNSSGKKDRLGILAAILKLRQVCIHPGLLKEVNSRSIPSAKFELVKEKIIELMDEGHKVVMFSQFTGMLDIIQSWATSCRYYIERIDGSVTGKSRQTAIDRFQTHHGAGIFVISLKAGGVGINLTAADYVMHLDPWWNPAIESQATDRVHRLGQKNKVFVYKFIAEGTIEEKIQQLQAEKRQLLAQIIDIDNINEKSINLDEIKSLILG